MPLSPKDIQHLGAAQGYCDLGMFLDADVELERMDPEVRHLPEVLEARVEIYRGLKKWELMQTVAKKLSIYDPAKAKWWIFWAYHPLFLMSSLI
jgi:hypothetical protein